MLLRIPPSSTTSIHEKVVSIRPSFGKLLLLAQDNVLEDCGALVIVFVEISFLILQYWFKLCLIFSPNSLSLWCRSSRSPNPSI